jgi:hypothetical protein
MLLQRRCIIKAGDLAAKERVYEDAIETMRSQLLEEVRFRGYQLIEPIQSIDSLKPDNGSWHFGMRPDELMFVATITIWGKEALKGDAAMGIIAQYATGIPTFMEEEAIKNLLINSRLT